MSHPTLVSHLDPTPDRPSTGVGSPPALLAVDVEVDTIHLGNPLVAVARLLASEAEAHARVVGDEERFTVTVVLPDEGDEAADRAEAWVRWAVHNAGVRGRITGQPEVDRGHASKCRPRPRRWPRPALASGARLRLRRCGGRRPRGRSRSGGWRR